MIKPADAVAGGGEEVGGLSVLNEQLRALELSLMGDGSVVPKHLTAVSERIIGEPPVDAVGGKGVNSSMPFAADFSGHVFEDRLEMIVLPPDGKRVRL